MSTLPVLPADVHLLLLDYVGAETLRRLPSADVLSPADPLAFAPPGPMSDLESAMRPRQALTVSEGHHQRTRSIGSGTLRESHGRRCPNAS